MLTLRAYKHLGLAGPARTATPQMGLFDAADGPGAEAATDHDTGPGQARK
jgi:hypothetical protein